MTPPPRVGTTSSLSAGRLDLLIHDAMGAALEIGQSDVIRSLQAALSASRVSARYELDVIACEVRGDAGVVPLSRGDRMLLIGLALHRRPCTRAEIIDFLYPHLSETTAATQLRVYVHRVRRQLEGATVIVQENGSYRLGEGLRVDLWEIETEVASSMREKGPLSPSKLNRLNEIRLRLMRRDFSLSTELEWASALERRLQALLFDVTTRLGEAALAALDLAGAAQFASEIFRLDPCDERGAELMVRSRLAAGDRVGAVREFRRYERTLREEFGVSPSRELTSILATSGRGEYAHE